jgi:hypothetical protein
MQQIKQYKLYVYIDNTDNSNIEYYDIYHDLQDRIMTLEIQGKRFKALVEYDDGTIEDVEDVFTV